MLTFLRIQTNNTAKPGRPCAQALPVLSHYTDNRSGLNQNIFRVNPGLKAYYAVLLLTALALIMFNRDASSQSRANYHSIRCQGDIETIMVGEDGSIARSINLGANWEKLSCGITNILNSSLIINKKNILAVADNGVILKTTDGGSNWKYKWINYENLNDITGFNNCQRIFACGDSGTMLVSEDLGDSWSIVKSGIRSNLRHIHFTGKSTGYAVGDNTTLLRTLDGGISWTALDMSKFGSHILYSIAVFDENNFTAAGSESSVFCSSDGGLTIFKASLPTIPALNLFDVVCSDEQGEVIVGELGLILKSFDKGLNWVVASVTGTGSYSKYFSFFSVAFPNPKYGIAIGPQELNYVTYDGGNTWTGDSTNYTGKNIAALVGRNEMNLSQNYPNPFNPSTVISYNLPFDASVTLTVYDMLGRHVKSLADGFQPSGNYDFRFDGSYLSSGIYFYVLKATGSGREYSKTMRMILTK